MQFSLPDKSLLLLIIDYATFCEAGSIQKRLQEVSLLLEGNGPMFPDVALIFS